MDQASPEGVVSPATGASVPPQVPAQNTAEPPKVETKAESPPAPVDEPKEPKGPGKRIDELTRNWRQEQRAHEETRRTNERLLALLEQRGQPQQAQPEGEEPEKELADFGYDAKKYRGYLEARAEARASKAAERYAERYRVEQEAISRRAKFDERVAQFAKSVEDYHEVVTDSTPVSEGMADFLLDSEEAGAVMYYLGNNPDEARKLYHLSPAKAGRELTKLEDRLIAERKKAAEKPVSQAPPPAPKIEASTPSHALKSTDPEAEKLSGNEWKKLREKELAALRKKRG